MKEQIIVRSSNKAVEIVKDHIDKAFCGAKYWEDDLKKQDLRKIEGRVAMINYSKYKFLYYQLLEIMDEMEEKQ